MKQKVLLLIASVTLALISCTQNENDFFASSDADAIKFDAYTSSVTTRGVAIESSEIIGQTSPSITAKGVGVFAFYQPAVAGSMVNFNTHKFATPDFMYNQQVTPATAGNIDSWIYTPTKYWPNNSGDRLSFFAYAPYDADKTWEELGIATDATASKITASFPIHNEKTAMQDILWADPQLNKVKASTTEKITFDFRHILSKVALYVGVETDKANGAADKWTDANTTITIDQVKFTNLADAYKYSCPINATGEMQTPTWSISSTTQNVVLTRENGDFDPDSSLISNTAPWNSTSAYHTLLAKENNKSAFLFLAPQTFTADKQQVIITYTVKTIDNNNKANCSTITNTIATNLSTILTNGFVSGCAYILKFLIGMNSVKFAASITDWDATSSHQVDVPSNTPCIVANTLATAQKALTNDNGNQTLTIKVTEDAVKNATTSDVVTIGGRKYLQFILKTTSPQTVSFELPAITGEDYQRLGVETWLVTYEQNYPTETVYIDAPSGSKVKIEAPTSHVIVPAALYAEITAMTGPNTFVVPNGTTVTDLIVNEGGLEIHGTVTNLTITETNHSGNPVKARTSENLSQSVFNVIYTAGSHDYIDRPNYHEEQNSDGTWNIVPSAPAEYEAQIETTQYTTLADAITAANATSDATIELLKDVTVSESNSINKSMTLDMKSKSISISSTFNVVEGKVLTIKDGSFSGCFSLTGSGTASITNGNVTSGGNALSCTGGTITINSGKFKGALSATSPGKIELKGGIYSADPSAYKASGYAVYPNPDESTKSEYPYMVGGPVGGGLGDVNKATGSW